MITDWQFKDKSGQPYQEDEPEKDECKDGTCSVKFGRIVDKGEDDK